MFQNIDNKSKCLIDRKLEKLGFVISSEDEELKIVKSMYNSIVYQSSRLELTIMMTMNCNFRCPYCFEGHENRENTVINIKNLIDWLKIIIEKYSFAELAICFHGGEPLLFSEQVKQMISEVKNNFPRLKFDFSCVTNGYFLSKNLASELYGLGIKRVQITLNGDREEHDKIRVLRNGKGTFDKIIDNIKQSECDFYIINILFNEKNVESMKSLISYLKDNNLHTKIKFLSINQIEKTIEKEINVYNKKIAKIKIELMEYALRLGFRIPFELNFNACTIQQKNAFVISPNEKIYKCISLIGDDKVFIGCLKDEPETLYKNQARLVEEQNNCYKCKYYPICNTMCLFQDKLKNKFCKKSYYDEFIPYYLDLYRKYKDLFYRG